MSIGTPGEAYRLSWRVRARCIRGTIETPVRLQRCEYTAELDMLLRTLRLKLGVADTDTKIILRSGPPPAGT